MLLRAPAAIPATPVTPLVDRLAVSCLPGGDGYLKARLKGALDTTVDWPNAGTRCEGEERPNHGGLRLSFRREPASAPDLLFVFGISHIRENQPARGVAANLTIIEQGGRIYGTQGDSRCTVDSLRQTPLDDAAQDKTAAATPTVAQPRRYRIEVHGFCTSPARALREQGSVLVTSFDFAGAVRFDPQGPGDARARGDLQEHGN